jgi:hypothetical protein
VIPVGFLVIDPQVNSYAIGCFNAVTSGAKIPVNVTLGGVGTRSSQVVNDELDTYTIVGPGAFTASALDKTRSHAENSPVPFSRSARIPRTPRSGSRCG